MQRLDLDGAIAKLRQGGLVAFSTETVYGLGADAGQDRAVVAIYEAKDRPAFNPLIVHVGSVKQAQTLGVWNDRAEALANAFWPGPLTLVLERREGAGLSPIVSAGARTVALRCPGFSQARALAAALPCGIAAPSANKSGQLSPTRTAHVLEAFVDQPHLGLLAGEQEPDVGLESTVVDLSGPAAQLLRNGAITQEMIEAVIGKTPPNEAYLEDFADEQVASPGQLKRHYAPPVPLLLEQSSAGPGQALLAFGPSAPSGSSGSSASSGSSESSESSATWVYNLSQTGDLAEAAARLFIGLHTLGGSGASAICAMPIPNEGIGRAINDRLSRGAVPAP